MINYRTYNVEDFLLDELFRQWTTKSSPQAILFWERWLAQNPDRADVVRQAQELVRVLEEQYRDEATDDRFDHELARLMSRAAEQRDAMSNTPVIPLARQSGWRWAAAASVLLLISIGTWRYFSSPKEAADSYTFLTKAVATPLQEKVNTGKEALTVLLGDGTIVTLNPNSRLSYPPLFNKTSRTVYLSGEAFFEVTKNPARPFLIYANQTVTKVLGTSFLVRAYTDEENVTVTVKTGRVSVYSQKNYEQAQQTGLRRVEGVILTPNQQMTYNLADNRLVKALVEKPAALITIRPSREQLFEDVPVARVFASIERMYGIKLLYDDQALAACLVNLSFKEENLLERLDVICQTIGASYEMLDGQIVITSKGCR